MHDWFKRRQKRRMKDREQVKQVEYKWSYDQLVALSVSGLKTPKINGSQVGFCKSVL